MVTKNCTKCKKDFPDTKEYYHIDSKRGLRKVCKFCSNEYRKNKRAIERLDRLNYNNKISSYIIIANKTCNKCKKEYPNTKEYYHVDIRRGLKNVCKFCANEYKRNKRIIESAGKYYTNESIAHYFNIDINRIDLIEAQRYYLILKDRIENKHHCVVNEKGFYCAVCKVKEDIIFPISLKKFNEVGKSFMKNHEHNV